MQLSLFIFSQICLNILVFTVNIPFLQCTLKPKEFYTGQAKNTSVQCNSFVGFQSGKHQQSCAGDVCTWLGLALSIFLNFWMSELVFIRGEKVNVGIFLVRFVQTDVFFCNNGLIFKNSKGANDNQWLLNRVPPIPLHGREGQLPVHFYIQRLYVYYYY